MGGFKSERAVLRAWIDLPESSHRCWIKEGMGLLLGLRVRYRFNLGSRLLQLL